MSCAPCPVFCWTKLVSDLMRRLYSPSHVAHHMLAIYALGANRTLLREGYDNDEDDQRPIGKSPEPISDANFADHLGDGKYYQGYLEFFSNQLVTKGIHKTLKVYLYSKGANFNDRAKVDSTQPEMFCRFMSGLMHPLIHVGNGLEFGLLGVLAEGTHFWIQPGEYVE